MPRYQPFRDQPGLGDLHARFVACLNIFEKLVASPTAVLETEDTRRRLEVLGEALALVADNLTIRALEHSAHAKETAADVREQARERARLTRINRLRAHRREPLIGCFLGGRHG